MADVGLAHEISYCPLPALLSVGLPCTVSAPAHFSSSTSKAAAHFQVAAVAEKSGGTKQSSCTDQCRRSDTACAGRETAVLPLCKVGSETAGKGGCRDPGCAFDFPVL